MAETLTFSCRRNGCGGPRSGVCINSLPFDECPDVIEFYVNKINAQEAVPGSSTQNLISVLPGGHSLNHERCDALLRERGGTVISVVAGPDVGKTTFIASIYELLHRRRMISFGFAGSETLRGFEERCHLARLASNSTTPDTERTRVGNGLNFTHLRVATPISFRELYFADRSGEDFQKILATPSLISNYSELKRADIIILLVDLVKLSSNKNLIVSEIRRLFIAMKQNGFFEGSKLFVVGTKADLAVLKKRNKKSTTGFDELTMELTRRAAGQFSISQHVIACRARKNSTAFGEGIELLLKEILDHKSIQLDKEDVSWPAEKKQLDFLMRNYRSRVQ